MHALLATKRITKIKGFKSSKLLTASDQRVSLAREESDIPESV